MMPFLHAICNAVFDHESTVLQTESKKLILSQYSVISYMTNQFACRVHCFFSTVIIAAIKGHFPFRTKTIYRPILLSMSYISFHRSQFTNVIIVKCKQEYIDGDARNQLRLLLTHG